MMGSKVKVESSLSISPYINGHRLGKYSLYFFYFLLVSLKSFQGVPE